MDRLASFQASAVVVVRLPFPFRIVVVLRSLPGLETFRRTDLSNSRREGRFDWKTLRRFFDNDDAVATFHFVIKRRFKTDVTLNDEMFVVSFSNNAASKCLTILARNVAFSRDVERHRRDENERHEA